MDSFKLIPPLRSKQPHTIFLSHHAKRHSPLQRLSLSCASTPNAENVRSTVTLFPLFYCHVPPITLQLANARLKSRARATFSHHQMHKVDLGSQPPQACLAEKKQATSITHMLSRGLSFLATAPAPTCHQRPR
ncbi:hypothetical protein TRVL_03922 [Trypanosoma vivax]|nr:hypothetical protein TRVL_03922 [Trypanosoma vivax]